VPCNSLPSLSEALARPFAGKALPGVVVAVVHSRVVVMQPSLMTRMRPVVFLPRVDDGAAPETSILVNHVHLDLLLRNHQMEKAEPSQVPAPVPHPWVIFRVDPAPAAGDEARQATQVVRSHVSLDPAILGAFMPQLLLVAVTCHQQVQPVPLVEIPEEGIVGSAWEVGHYNLPIRGGSLHLPDEPLFLLVVRLPEPTRAIPNVTHATIGPATRPWRIVKGADVVLFVLAW